MDTPKHILKAAENVINNLLPQKSSGRYWKEYELFVKWCTENGVSTYNEHVLLAYFEHKSKNLKSSTLWSIFSMLKSTLNIKHNINIEKYTKLIAFLKRTNDGYVAKKSKTLEIEEIEKFINEASNEDYLLIKTALIIGMSAACRRHELAVMKVQDVQDRGDLIIITIPDTKTKKPRSSCITEPLWIEIIKLYATLRPQGTENNRFFLFYSKNKCTRQPVGIHSFGKMPSKIATFLKLDNPALYTGHCFRRSSATVLAGHGADITTLKRHGGWKSTTVAEGYIEDSLKSKIAIANHLVNQSRDQTRSIPEPSTRSASSSALDIEENVENLKTNSSNVQNVQLKLNDSNLPNINISNCENCTINFHFK